VLKENLKLIGWLIFLIVMFFGMYQLYSMVIEYGSEKAEKNIMVEEQKLIDEFTYKEDATYIVTDKKEGNRFYGMSIFPAYYFTAVNEKDNKVYLLQVPKSLYLRTVTGNEIVLKEGKDETYSLTKDMKSVIAKGLYEETN